MVHGVLPNASPQTVRIEEGDRESLLGSSERARQPRPGIVCRPGRAGFAARPVPMRCARPLPHSALALSLLLLFLPAGCQSAEPAKKKYGEPEPYVPLPDEGPESIGFFLARFDRSLRQWSDLVLTASNAREQNELQALEVSMRDRAKKRRDELVTTLETGAPLN